MKKNHQNHLKIVIYLNIIVRYISVSKHQGEFPILIHDQIKIFKLQWEIF